MSPTVIGDGVKARFSWSCHPSLRLWWQEIRPVIIECLFRNRGIFGLSRPIYLLCVLGRSSLEIWIHSCGRRVFVSRYPLCDSGPAGRADVIFICSHETGPISGGRDHTRHTFRADSAWLGAPNILPSLSYIVTQAELANGSVVSV